MKREQTFIIMPAVVALFMLGIVFVFLPDGWNVIPLLLMALVLKGLSVSLKSIKGPSGVERSAQISAAEDEEVRPVDVALGPPVDRTVARRMNRAFGPIAAGMVIDLVDLATFGPIGLVLGLPLGGLAGYWMGRALGLDIRTALWCAVAAAVYCTIPGTEMIPLATLLGAFVRFKDSGKR